MDNEDEIFAIFCGEGDHDDLPITPTKNERSIYETEEIAQREREKIVFDVIDMLDDVYRATQIVDQNNGRGLILLAKRLESKLQLAFGVCAFNPLHNLFDPKRHEAIATTTDLTFPHHAITCVYSLGYEIGERLIRPAKVAVNIRK